MESSLTVAQPVALEARELGPRVSWREALGVFLTRLDSDNTRRAYRRAIIEALERIGRPMLADVSGADLAAYRAELLRDDRAPGTRALYLAAVRSFLLWARLPHVGACQLLREVIEEALKMPRAKVRRPYEILTEAEFSAVLRVARTPRDRALVAVMADAGLRVSEVVSLDVSDVRELPDGGGFLYVRMGKGAKDRNAPASDAVLKDVRSYLEASGRTMRADGALFRAHDRGAARRDRARMSARAAGSVIAGIVEAAGIEGKRISPHSLRHTFAIRFLRGGGRIEALQKILGHSSLAVTSRYLDHLELSEMIEMLPARPAA